MIISEQSDFRRYASVNKHFSKVCDFLENTNLTDLVDGKIDIDGENVFANCMTYLADGVPGDIFETHKKYLDIHIVVENTEKMAVTSPVRHVYLLAKRRILLFTIAKTIKLLNCFQGICW